MRSRFSWVVRGLLLVALLVFTLTPCIALATDDAVDGQGGGAAAITDSSSSDKGGSSEDEGGPGSEVSNESESNANASDAISDEAANGADPSEDEAAGSSSENAPSSDEGFETGEDGVSETQTMSEEDFYSRFRGNSFRYSDGESISTYAGNVTWEKRDGVIVFSNDVRTNDATAMGIDVSEHNGTIDWSRVKASGVDFAILRIGFGNGGGKEDAQFRANVRGCINNGIPFGVYLYTYTWDETTSRNVANWVLGILNDCGLEPDDLALPVFFDMENQNPHTGVPSGVDTNNNYRPISGATFAQMANAFCTTIETAGYEAGVYANKYWW